MTIARLSWDEARAANRQNRFKSWPHRTDGASGESEQACDRIHQDFAKVSASPLKPIEHRRYFAIGSCFARVIENGLRQSGQRLAYDLRKLLPSEHLFERVAPGIPSRDPTSDISGIFNRYNVPSMLQEVEIYAHGYPEPSEWLLYQTGDKWADLNYHLALADSSFDVALARRALIFDHFSRALREANTFILTLGLCEAWYDLEAAAYLNTTPSPRLPAAYPNRFQVRMVDYDTNLSALLSVVEMLEEIKQSGPFEIILTVSPVPLNQTFFDQDIVVANSEAKAILRAAASEARRRSERVSYFPSFEIVMNSDPALAWHTDGMHVTPAMARHVVDCFLLLTQPAPD